MSPECLICGEPVDPSQPGGLVQRFAGFDKPAIYCPTHAAKVKPTQARRREGFQLTAVERASIFAGDHPRIERERSEPQLEVGDVVELGDYVSITIKAPRGVNKHGMVQYRYDVSDQRLDRPRLLRQNPPAHRTEHDEEDRLRPLTPALEARAAEESAYTSSNLSAVPHEPENTDDPRALAATARLRRAQSVDPAIAEDLAKRQARSINENVREILIQRARLGLPTDSPGMASLQRALDEARAELESSEAA